jgi:hypothetical protein
MKIKRRGIIIIFLGLVLFIFTTITFFSKAKVDDIEYVNNSANKPQRSSWSPVTGLAIIGFGGVMLWMSLKKNKKDAKL